jgi:hypothetical protein
MNFLNSAFDSSNFIKSNVNCNQWNVPQINTTTNNNNNKTTTTSTGDNTKPTNFIMTNSNPALNRTYCSKTQLYCESISRALDITSCKVVPFFGTFLHDFRQILDGVPSQIVMCNKNIQKPIEVNYIFHKTTLSF